MRLIVNILFIVMASVLVGCNGFNGDSVPPSFFYVAVEGNEGADLLDENTPDNILNEKIQYVIDGSEYKIAWQPPYKNAQYIYGNFAHIKKLGSTNYLTSTFLWVSLKKNPVDFKLVLGSDEFEFSMFESSGKENNVIILPNGTRHVFDRYGFIILIKYDKDGAPTVSLMDLTELYQ